MNAVQINDNLMSLTLFEVRMETCSRVTTRAIAFWILVLLQISAQTAAAQGWNLPAELNDKNTKVGFQVDSTWHLIHGTTKGVTGKAWLENENDPSSVRAKVSLPVNSFNTDNSSRDSRMREVMQADKFNEVVFELVSLGEGCSPTALESLPECRVAGHGRITIRGVTHEVDLPMVVKLKAGTYQVAGTAKIKWPDFGVEDPSILVARLAKEVEVHFAVALAKAS